METLLVSISIDIEHDCKKLTEVVESRQWPDSCHCRRLDAGRGGADDLLKSMESNKKGLEQRIAEWEREVEETGQALAGKKEEHLSAISTVADLTTDLEASSAELQQLNINRSTTTGREQSKLFGAKKNWG